MSVLACVAGLDEAASIAATGAVGAMTRSLCIRTRMSWKRDEDESYDTHIVNT